MRLTNLDTEHYGDFQPISLQLVENDLVTDDSISLKLTMQEASDLLDRLLMSGEADNETLTKVLRKLIDAMPA